MAFYGRWAPYVPAAQRRATAAREANKLAKSGKKLRPVHVKSRAIASSFWGRAWCKNLEIYADWANRMPRGRTYARNGSILDLQIEAGEITALVAGSSLYKIKISIAKLNTKKWTVIRKDCAQHVSSLLDLMRGRLPAAVLQRLTDDKTGMFPSPKELNIKCSCPDVAKVCKHVAATLYAVGYLLDGEPELFFKMRGVDQSELVSEAISAQTTSDAIGLDQQSDLAGEDLGAIFGIDLSSSQSPPPKASTKSSATTSAPKVASPTKTKTTAKQTKKASTAKRVSRKRKQASPAKTQTATSSKSRAGAGSKKTATKSQPKSAAKPAKKATRKDAQPAAAPRHSSEGLKAKRATRAKRPG